jgi:hypothetical protein
MLNGGTGPEALPKEISMPKGRSESSEPSNVSADGVHDHVTPLPPVSSCTSCDPILVAIVDAGFGPVIEGKLAFVVRARGADQADALRRGPLAGHQADTPGRGMEQDVVALADGRRAAKQVMRGQPLSIIAAPSSIEMPSGSGQTCAAFMTRASV